MVQHSAALHPTLTRCLPCRSPIPQERFKWSEKAAVHVPANKPAAAPQPAKPAAAAKAAAGGKKDKGERRAQEGGGQEAPAAAKRGKAAAEADAAEAAAPAAESAAGKKDGKRPAGKAAAAAAAAAEGEQQQEGEKEGEARKAMDPARRGLGPALMVGCLSWRACIVSVGCSSSVLCFCRLCCAVVGCAVLWSSALCWCAPKGLGAALVVRFRRHGCQVQFACAVPCCGDVLHSIVPCCCREWRCTHLVSGSQRAHSKQSTFLPAECGDAHLALCQQPTHNSAGLFHIVCDWLPTAGSGDAHLVPPGAQVEEGPQHQLRPQVSLGRARWRGGGEVQGYAFHDSMWPPRYHC